jgi:predicted metal-dependent peptidase
MTSDLDPISVARFKLGLERRYLQAALWNLKPIPTPGIGTLGVDKRWNLYYDPECGKKWSIEELAGVLYHEVMHLLRNHPERGELAGDADGKLFNVAGDAEINDDLVNEPGVTLPNPHVQPSMFGMPNGLLAEQYYATLQKKQQQQQQQEGKQGQKGQQQGQGKLEPGNGSCGSCATGQPGEKETAEGGLGEHQAELVRRQVANDVMAEKSRGTVPGHLEAWANEKLKPKVDWRKQCRAVIRRAVAYAKGQMDFSYSRPSRRQSLSKDVILPTMIRPLPSVAIVVDTSGSMSQNDLDLCIGEVQGICEQLAISPTVLAVDASVHGKPQKVSKGSQVKLLGRGGTDMRVGISAALELTPKPNVLVILTDGETPWPDRQASKVVHIVCLIGKGREHVRSMIPSWCKTVMVEPD